MTMKKIFPTFAAVLACLWLTGCTEHKQAVTDSIVISTSPATVKAPAGSKSVTIFATRDWQTAADTWLTVEPARGGRGIHAVRIGYETNDTGQERSGTVTFTAGTRIETYTLTQPAE